jgi:hypothetical protein
MPKQVAMTHYPSFTLKAFRILAIASATVLVTGCATQLTFKRREALDYFVGRDRATVTQRLGQPTRVARRDGGELLTYDEHAIRWVPGEPDTRDTFGNPEGPSVDDDRCATTFRLTNGRVDAWRLEGNGCSHLEFPPAGPENEPVLQEANKRGVDSVATFAHDEYTGRSIVNYGEFQSH